MKCYKLLRLILGLAWAMIAVRGNTEEKPAKESLYQIKQDILKRYNKTHPPPVSADYPFKVTCMIAGLAIKGVNLKTGVVDMKLYHATNWRDSRLEYKARIGNMTRDDKFLTFNTDQIWNPKFHPWNGFIFLEQNDLLIVGDRGIVYQLEPLTTDTICAFNDARYFPYDEHQCDIIYSKFDHQGKAVPIDTQIYLHNFGKPSYPFLNHVWIIKNLPTFTKEIYKDISGFEHQAVRLRFTLSRQERTFVVTAICSALSALFVSSLTHLMEPNDGTLVRLTLSGFSLTILACVNLFFQHYTPLDIDRPPIVYTLCNLSFAIVLISILQTVIANSILTRSTGPSPSPTLTGVIKNPLCLIVYWMWGWNDTTFKNGGDQKRLVSNEEEGESDYSSFASTASLPTDQNGQIFNSRLMLVLVLDFYLFLALQILFAAFFLFILLL